MDRDGGSGKKEKMSDEKIETQDINTDSVIRMTDNSPKEGDEMLKANQHSRPLTSEEIEDIIKGYAE